jgi:predicted DNA-binding transcriptional regulator YafY
MNRIDRLFGILTIIQSRKFIPAERIADRFEISIRTVYRDVRALCELGIPISFEKNKGYFIVNGYFLPPISFTNEEARSLLLIEAITSLFADQSTISHFSSALSKVKAVLKSSQKEGLDTLNRNMHVQFPRDMKIQFNHLPTIQQAIITKTVLDLEYQNNKGESSKRQVESIGLVFYALNWHLIAWCHLRQGYRDFKIPHMLSLKLTGASFRKNNHIELGGYLSQIPVNY